MKPKLDSGKEERWNDSLRGAMWEGKWRGTLEEYPSPDTLELAGRIWYREPEPKEKKVDWPIGPIGLGTYGWKYNPKIIREALSLGYSLIDTAETYGYGKVEKEIGKILEKEKNLPWIATKAARNHLSRVATMNAAYRSRENLRVESIDLYQIHWPVRPMEPTFDSLANLLEEGVIKRVGVSNFCAGQLSLAIRLAEERGFSITSNQIRVNRKDRGNLAYLVPFCNRVGVAVIAYSPLGQKGVRGDVSKDLSWLLTQGISCVIPATNNLSHLRGNIGGVETKKPAG